MNTPWIIGLLAAIVFFAVFEAIAFRHPDRVNTLSRCIWTIGQTWPMSIWLMGVFAGVMAAHLFWNWDPRCMPPGVGG